MADLGRCRMAVVLLLDTMAVTRLDLIWGLHRISWYNLGAIGRIEGFQHREIRRRGNPTDRSVSRPR